MTAAIVLAALAVAAVLAWLIRNLIDPWWKEPA